MARYEHAIDWIAQNDGAGDTHGQPYEAAYAVVYDMVTVAMVADVFGKKQHRVALDVMRARGFRKPLGWRPPTWGQS